MTIQPSNLTQMEAQLRSLSLDTPQMYAPAFEGPDEARTPRPWRRAVAMILALAGIAAGVSFTPLRQTVLSAWGEAAQPVAEQTVSAVPETAALATAATVPVPTALVAAPQQLIGSGYSRAERDVVLGAPVPGRIAAVAVVEGAHVAADQPLIQMQDRSPREAVLAAQVQVQQSAYAQTAAELALADVQATQARLQTLAARGASTPREVEENLYAVKTTELAAEQARLAVVSAKNTLTAAQADLADHVLRAPFAGQIATLQASVGMMTYGDRDDALVRLFDPQSLVVDVDIAERNLGDLTLGMAANVVFDAWPNQEFAGKVAAVAPILTKERGTLRVTIALQDIPAQLRPNMAARATLTLSDTSQTSDQNP